MAEVHGKVDEIGSEVSRITAALRGFLTEGRVSDDRRIKTVGTQVVQNFLNDILARLDRVNTDLIDVGKLTSTISPLPLAHDPTTPLSYNSPPSHPSRGLDGPPLPLPSDEPLDQPQHHQQAEQPSPEQHGDPHNQLEQEEVQIESVQENNHQPLLELPAAYQGALYHEQKSPPPLPTQPVANQEVPKPEKASSPPIALPNRPVSETFTVQEHAAPLFDCTYQDVHKLNEELFERCSSHPEVQDRGYFKLHVRDLPPLAVHEVSRPGKYHATSFTYQVDRHGLVKVDTGKRIRFKPPHLPFPPSQKKDWTFEEQKELWNSSAAIPPEGSRPYIIGNPLFEDIELHPGEKLKRRGRTVLEGINTQYVYFNLTGKTITTMHREDAHVRSENLLRSGEHKFWCFIKPAFAAKFEERMQIEYPEMRRCSQAVRHLSRHIPPSVLDAWGIEYTLDYCYPGQAVVTEPGTYHQVLNLGPNYALAVNVEYESSPDDPPNYRFCDNHCPDKFAMKADDFHIHDNPEKWAGRNEHDGSAARSSMAASKRSSMTATKRSSMTSTKRSSMTPGRQPSKTRARQVSMTEPPQMLEAADAQMARAPTEPSPTSEPAPEPIPQEQTASSQSSSLSKKGGASPEASQCPKRLPEQAAPAEYQQDSVLRPPVVDTTTPIQAAMATPAPTVPSEPRHHLPSGLSAPPSVPAAQSSTLELAASAPTPYRKTARILGNKRPSEGTSNPQVVKKPRPLDLPAAPTSAHQAASVGQPQLAAMQLGGLSHNTALSRLTSSSDEICGKPAFDRLARLFEGWRAHCKSSHVDLGGLNMVNHVEEMSRDDNPELHTFLRRFCQMKLAETFERMAKAPQRSVTGSEDVTNDMLTELDWDDSQRHRLHDYLREGKCWITLTNRFEGLLPLLPPGSDADAFELALFNEQVTDFENLLQSEFVRKLCAVGKTFQDSIWNCLELPEFVFETAYKPWFTVQQIMPMLKKFTLLKETFYDEQLPYYWGLPPPNWSLFWGWPTNPMAVPSHVKWCDADTCRRRTMCKCASKLIPEVPRISINGAKGRGIRAVGVFEQGEILGELTGELVPAGMFSGGGSGVASEWTWEVRRPDVRGKEGEGAASVVAEIWPRERGNWVRLVPHDDNNPCTEFQLKKLTGKWRVCLTATRRIGDGEEIKVRYGAGYLRGM
ncbi:hypothetical protein QBC42DRAFT_165701 [Cladorrhinum samala]|uniref:JmjC domain-containing protein n=1 Tax=Cladorrhinum samala TaxID=585594 RepID=A0AAV9I1J6_9PEZI|nr:hypothetical protein QBC42DRAFT_165701 [Cladorrhinum samala]